MTQEQQPNPPCICGHPENEHEDLLGCAHRDRDGFSCPCAHVAGEPTPPATPQPETPMKLEGYDGYQFCPLCGVVLPCRAHGRVPVTTTDFAQLSADCALSTPPDVERLTREAYERGFRDGFDAAQSWGCDMVEEALRALSRLLEQK